VSSAYSSVTKRFSRVPGARIAAEEAAESREARAKFVAGQATLAKAVFERPASETAHTFADTTRRLVKNKAFEKIGTKDRYVDIIKDVINLLPIHWLSQEVVRIVSCLYDDVG
jgi:linoleate 10R-lipoxygenase